MARVGFDPSVVSDATALFPLGLILENAGKKYAYFLNSDAATANGDVMHITATISTAQGGTAPTVNNRLIASGGTPTSLDNNTIMGVAVGVVAASQYGFFQVYGYHAAVKVEATVAAGDWLKPSTATDARAVVVSAATHKGQVKAITAAVATLSACWIQL